ncbi:MAG: hypothetical protein N2692_03075, partial [Patescibacteria group bacterium]|nr:hypothetical protein [Patescibacteria group bacterium]
MKETLENWLNGLIVKLKQKYNQMGLKASGRWERGLNGQIEEKENGGYTITLEGEKYTGILVYGRRPTSPNKRGRLYGVILNWVEQKGIRVDNKKRFAYFVAKKID